MQASFIASTAMSPPLFRMLLRKVAVASPRTRLVTIWRTRVGSDGMDYKGYNIAIHELGHNVEQVFSVTTIDHTLLQGVPNTAFTEAMAFVFQNQNLRLLGLGEPDADAAHWAALDTFWGTREIAGVALVDMAAWRWLYDHPDAEPAELREAVLGIAREVWNRYFAPVFGIEDQVLLAVYSHMVDCAMYTQDYPLGHLIAFQIERHFATFGGSLGGSFGGSSAEPPTFTCRPTMSLSPPSYSITKKSFICFSAFFIRCMPRYLPMPSNSLRGWGRN